MSNVKPNPQQAAAAAAAAAKAKNAAIQKPVNTAPAPNMQKLQTVAPAVARMIGKTSPKPAVQPAPAVPPKPAVQPPMP